MNRAIALLALATSAAFGQVPEIPFTSALNLKLPPSIHLGEVAGVATNSKGNLYVFTRTGADATMGGSRVFTHGGSRLLEFSPTGLYLRELGADSYGMLFAQSVKVDAKDNVWIVDRGSNLVVVFNPAGRIIMTLGRKPESVSLAPPAAGRGGRGGNGAGVPGDNFVRPADVAWDAAGNIFVADGYGNSRVAKFDKSGKFLKSWGLKGTEPGQFDRPQSIAVDANGNVYVADNGNKRIQVFDNDGVFKSQFQHPGAPMGICISPGTHQYLYSSNSNAPDAMDNGEIYKMELDGKILGKFGMAGRQSKEFGSVNQIDCRGINTLYVGEVMNWRVQKVTLK